MGRTHLQICINTPEEQHTRTITIESVDDKLRAWGKAYDDIPKLERQLERIDHTIAELKLSEGKILSSITQQTENMDMPRGGDVSDKVGDMVARVVDKINMLEAEREVIVANLRYSKFQIASIEECLGELDDRYRKILEMFYRDGMHWAQICSRLFISKPRMYQMLEIAKRALFAGTVPIYQYRLD